MKKQFWNRKYSNIYGKIVFVVIILTMALIGARYLLASHAASVAISLEPETGGVSSGASIIDDTSASGGKSIRFAAVTPTPPACQKDTTYTAPTNITLSSTAKGLIQNTNDIHYYTVNGYTIQQITDQLRACRNSLITVDNNQYHEWRMNYVYNWTPASAGKCTLTRVAVGLHVKFITPKLTASTYIDAATKSKWDAYLVGLAKYQQGYRDRDVAAANKMLAGINALTNTSCTTIDAVITKYATSQIDALKATNASYQTSTQYGKTLGAWFP